jgi:PKD repeat protein
VNLKTAIDRWWVRTCCAAAIVLNSSSYVPAQVLVDVGSPISYLANSADPGMPGLVWTDEEFDASGWSEGLFGIGYEESVDAADVKAGRLLTSFVPVGSLSVYARAEFTIADASSVESLSLALDYDDAVVAWINGIEVYRSPEMPPGAPAWDTLPLDHESSNGVNPDLSQPNDISAIGLSLLESGRNVLAIGVWNDSAASTDLVLAPRLWANSPGGFVTRGPYLQLATDHGIVVRWRTNQNTKSAVHYGLAPNQLDQVVSRNGARRDHEISLTNLAADTTYYYAVGTVTELLAGNDSEHRFRTAPVPGTRRPIRIWAVGDTGTPNADSAAVRDAFVALNGGTDVDLWLMLGDNAYDYGTQDEYEGALFNRYPRMLRRSTLWPTLGNHDTESASASNQSGVYYDIFTLPSSAQAGGLSSGTEAYYAFDYANVHFVVLNSEDSDRSPTAPMLTWLDADLMSTNQDWVVAYWHSPPYSKGSHDSDNLGGSDEQLVEMREAAVPTLEEWGVDLVLTGHSHVYERSALLDGHYGYSESLSPEMLLDDGDGRPSGDGAYQKPSSGPSGHEGAVFVVAGNGSEVFDTVPGDHPVMIESQERLGSVVIEIDGDRLESTYVDASGIVGDRFTIVKNTSTLPQAGFDGAPLIGAAPLTVEFHDLSSTNSAAWGWDFDGDGNVDSSLRNPASTFVEPGLHEVSLTVANAAGSDQERKPGYVCASALPGNVTGLVLTGTGTLQWDPVAGATVYDVIGGDLGALLDAAGDFAGSDPVCMGDALSGPEFSDPAAPYSRGTYYVVRGVSCADETGPYDSGGPNQQAPRGTSLPAAPAVCP